MLMDNNERRHAAVFAGLLVVVMGMGVAPATRAGMFREESVKVSDLNLGSAQGQRAFERRIAAAIDRVCAAPGPQVVINSRNRRQLDACRREAWDGVRAQLQAHGLQPIRLASRG